MQLTADKKAAVAHIRWVASLTEGGRRQRVSVFSVTGNTSGKVGLGLGKAKDTSSAVKKSLSYAKKNMVRVPMKQKRTVHHDMVYKYGSTQVLIKPGKEGSGIKASNSIRLLLDSAGFKDISIKCLCGSRNRINVLKCVLEALRNISSAHKIANRRGVSHARVVGNEVFSDELLTKGEE